MTKTLLFTIIIGLFTLLSCENSQKKRQDKSKKDTLTEMTLELDTNFTELETKMDEIIKKDSASR